MKKIIPAILTRNVADLQEKLLQIKKITDLVQIDIMDGKFVDNISIKIEDISKTNIAEKLFIEVHLMVANPEKYFLQCQANNVKRVIFHIEGVDDVKKVLAQADSFSFQRGLALRPDTPIIKVAPYLKEVDVVLLMSVNPGLQGQKFIESTISKIKELKRISGKVKIEVDGGINIGNIKSISDAGADYLVSGSDLLRSKNMTAHFKELKNKIYG